MIAQVVLAAIFLLILVTFKTPPEFSVRGERNFTLENFEANLPFSFRKVQALSLKEKAEAKVDPELEAKSAYIFDIKENKILYEKNALEIRPLASLSKLMTALLLIERVSDSATVPISEEARLQAGWDGLEAGESYKKERLSDLMLAASSNDAAWAAGQFAGGNIENFVSMMNARARSLGLGSMSFSNPHGLDILTASGDIPGASGSAKEIGQLFTFIHKNYAELLTKTRAARFKIVSQEGRVINAKNTNEALKDIPQLIASKTGSTQLAGGNLVFIFDAGFDHPILVSILGSSDKGRFSDAKKITDAVLRYFEEKNGFKRS